MKSRRKWLCLDCKIDTGKAGEHYMLVDKTWALVHNSNKGMICVGCVEKRLGRKLNSSDFNDSHVNRIKPGEYKSTRLMERINAYWIFYFGCSCCDFLYCSNHCFLLYYSNGRSVAYQTFRTVVLESVTPNPRQWPARSNYATMGYLLMCETDWFSLLHKRHDTMSSLRPIG